MPRLDSIGVIPLQWQGTEPGVGRPREQQQKMNDLIFDIATSASRFKILNRDLVTGLWSTPDGRKQLHDEYEMDGYLSIVCSLQGDSLRMVGRLLSPELQVYLTETESVSYAKFVDASKEELQDQLKTLVYRLFNRMPIDVSITSVQGAFVSLSGGSKQGLAIGDEFDVVSPAIKSLHPADQSWLQFTESRKGKVRIVDVSEGSSVGSIMAQTYDGAVSVGDGIKIPQLKGRRHFLVLSDKAEFQAAQNDDVILAAPALVAKEKKTQPRPVERLIERPEAREESREEPSEAIDKALPTPSFDRSEVERHAQEQGRMVVRPGIRNWSYGGGLKSRSAMAMTLLNYVDLRYPVRMFSGISTDVTAKLEFGKTSDGQYSGIGAGWRAYQRQSLELADVIKGYRYGGEVDFETLSVSGDAFGGQDILKFTGFAGLDGMVTAADFPLYWIADVSLSPFAWGQMGIKGSKRTLGSYSSLALRSELIAVSSQDFEWGGGFEVGSSSMKAGSTVSLSDMKLLALLRYRF